MEKCWVEVVHSVAAVLGTAAPFTSTALTYRLRSVAAVPPQASFRNDTATSCVPAAMAAPKAKSCTAPAVQGRHRPRGSERLAVQCDGELRVAPVGVLGQAQAQRVSRHGRGQRGRRWSGCCGPRGLVTRCTSYGWWRPGRRLVRWSTLSLPCLRRLRSGCRSRRHLVTRRSCRRSRLCR